MISSPVTISELSICVGDRCHPVTWSALRSQISGGRSWAVRDEAGVIVGIAGLYPAIEGGLDGWYWPGPAARSGMLQMIRAIRLTLSQLPHDQIHIVTRTPQGGRIARLAGFKRHDTVGKTERWIHERGS